MKLTVALLLAFPILADDPPSVSPKPEDPVVRLTRENEQLKKENKDLKGLVGYWQTQWVNCTIPAQNRQFIDPPKSAAQPEN